MVSFWVLHFRPRSLEVEEKARPKKFVEYEAAAARLALEQPCWK
jgi:hypothetical protein